MYKYVITTHQFYKRPTVDVAQALLGCFLVHETPQGITRGMIVETEAYLATDPASHSFRGQTSRNTVMFGQAGQAYIYFTYGMHYCLNAVTGAFGEGEAVLLRALAPVTGIELMRARRGRDDLYQLCSGPAKLVQAMGVSGQQNGTDLTKRPLYIETATTKSKIIQSRRIGISQGKELEYRFTISGNKFCSRK